MATIRRVSLFLTCAADALYPSAARACVEALESLGVQVDFREEQTCCGQPWINTGHPEEARRLALRFAEVFEDAEAIVAPSASCVDTIRNGYDGLFQGAPEVASRVRAVGERTFEFAEFLHRVLGVMDLPAHPRPERTTYHSTCRTLRGIGLRGVAEGYLAQMLGEAFVQLPDSETCCGFGGSFSVKMPEVSGRLLEDKLRAVRTTEASVVTSLDLSCLTHLAGGARRAGLDHLKFCHLAEVVAQALRPAPA
ncbi:MAG: (Fe-S)-binding protein [Deltaproteobacteria bacterium]|nr:(Fe-S)-binding protein [Deltaproteobacteria bacterium]